MQEERIIAKALRRAAEIDPVAWMTPYVARMQKRRNASYAAAEREIRHAVRLGADPFIPDDYDGPTAADCRCEEPCQEHPSCPCGGYAEPEF